MGTEMHYICHMLRCAQWAKNSQSCWDCSFKLGRNFGKMLNFSITSKKLAKIEALFLKVVIVRTAPRTRSIISHYWQVERVYALVFSCFKTCHHGLVLAGVSSMATRSLSWVKPELKPVSFMFLNCWSMMTRPVWGVNVITQIHG